jgi:glycosyltransferase involved in cell wall biosynthesis
MTATRVAVYGAQGPSSPSYRVRTVLPAGALAHEGVELVHRPLFDDAEFEQFCDGGVVTKAALALRARRRLLRQARVDPCDHVLIHRRADLFPDLRAERAIASGARVVLDVDDAIWLDAERTGAHPLALLKGSARKLGWIARRADEVIAGNELLAEHLARFSNAIQVIPSVVDTDAIPVRAHEQGPEAVVGWIGSETTAPYLDGVRDALTRAAARLGSERPLRLIVVGAGAGRSLEIPGVIVESLRWSLETERATLARMDVGLMPMPDTPWNRGKCAYKAVLYMAAGIPVVADPVGLIAEILGDGGILASETAGWSDALVTLLGDDALRARAGASGRGRVIEDFSLRRWTGPLAAVLRGSNGSKVAHVA